MMRLSILRGVISSVLTAVLALQTAPAAASSGLTPREEASLVSSLKQKALEIPLQSVVQVKLKSKETLRGRLARVTDEGMVMKVAQGQTIDDRAVAFSDVKSIKAENSGSHTKKWIIIAAVVGGIIVFVAIMAHLTTDH